MDQPLPTPFVRGEGDDPGERADPRSAGEAEIEGRIRQEGAADPAAVTRKPGEGRETPIANDPPTIDPLPAQGAFRWVKEGEDPIGEPRYGVPRLR